MAQKECIVCGAKLAADSVFCSECGVQLPNSAPKTDAPKKQRANILESMTARSVQMDKINDSGTSRF